MEVQMQFDELKLQAPIERVRGVSAKLLVSAWGETLV
jgi:hypothetical protein